MARKKSATPKARGTTPAASGRRSRARRGPAADPSLASYAALLDELKGRIRTAQVKAALAVNRELIGLYWDIGRSIIERQKAEGWGKAIVDRLAVDLQTEFPGEPGFSPRNIWHMRASVLAWTDDVVTLQQAAGETAYEKLKQPASELPDSILALLMRELDGVNLPQSVAAIPWFHNVVLMQKLKDPIERLWYARQTTEQGWSRAVLLHQIETDLYRRQGRALTNFDRTLPAPDSDLAQQAFKDPYCVGFLPLSAAARERAMERELVTRLREFLMELGVGFAFVGQQVHLEVGGRDFYVDLLFYHLRRDASSWSS